MLVARRVLVWVDVVVVVVRVFAGHGVLGLAVLVGVVVDVFACVVICVVVVDRVRVCSVVGMVVVVLLHHIVLDCALDIVLALFSFVFVFLWCLAVSWFLLKLVFVRFVIVVVAAGGVIGIHILVIDGAVVVKSDGVVVVMGGGVVMVVGDVVFVVICSGVVVVVVGVVVVGDLILGRCGCCGGCW